MKKCFHLDNYARNFYGDTDYTIMDGLLSQKGLLYVENSMFTNWKNAYYYREGFIRMRVDGREAKRFAKENGIEIMRGE